jgi:uncharacterized protein (TIGR02391 family)
MKRYRFFIFLSDNRETNTGNFIQWFGSIKQTSMDNIKTLLDEKLWNFIKRNYTSENYSSAVLDSIQFIGDLIRDKSGLETDGNNLIGQAFGGLNPKITLNKLQTETEINIQKGVESTLRGIYSAFRNPRSHSKYVDKEEDADAIILFINHLLKMIDKSKGKFSVEAFINRISDRDFVNNEKYIDLIIKSIPNKKYSETAFELFKSKDNVNINNLKSVFHKLLDKLTEEEIKELIEASSEELRYTESDSVVMKNVALFKKHWNQIAEDAKIRGENKLIKCLLKADYYEYELNNDGIYSSWLTEIVDSLTLKNEFGNAIFKKLSSGDKDQQGFVIKYFGQFFEEFNDPFNDLPGIINTQLSNGNKVIFDFVSQYISDKEIKKDIEESLKNFKDSEEADLPF